MALSQHNTDPTKMDFMAEVSMPGYPLTFRVYSNNPCAMGGCENMMIQALVSNGATVGTYYLDCFAGPDEAFQPELTDIDNDNDMAGIGEASGEGPLRSAVRVMMAAQIACDYYLSGDAVPFAMEARINNPVAPAA